MSIRAAILASSIALSLAAIPGLATAQWVWKDDQGHTVISDQAPPPSIPQKNIMRQPGRSAAPAPAPDAAGDANGPKSVADQDIEYKKRQKEAADAAKKGADEAERKQAIAEHCSAEKQNIDALQSGQRIARVDEQGNRYFVDDAARAAEIQSAQGDMSKNCK